MAHPCNRPSPGLALFSLLLAARAVEIRLVELDAGQFCRIALYGYAGRIPEEAVGVLDLVPRTDERITVGSFAGGSVCAVLRESHCTFYIISLVHIVGKVRGNAANCYSAEYSGEQ